MPEKEVHENGGPSPAVFCLKEVHDFEETRDQTILEGVVPMGLSTIIGLPSSGKSHIAVGQATAVASGRNIGEFRPTSAGRAIIFSGEMSPSECARRARNYASPGEIPDRLMIYPRPVVNMDLMNTLNSLLDRYPDTKIVVIDPLALYLPDAFNGGYAKQYSIYSGMREFAKDKKIAILAVTHTTKKPGERITSGYGSNALPGCSDSIQTIDRERHILCVSGNTIPDRRILLRWENDCYMPARTLDPRLKDIKVTVEQREVLEEIARRPSPMKAQDLGEIFAEEKTQSAVRQLLCKLKNSCLVVSKGKGNYTLSEIGKALLEEHKAASQAPIVSQLPASPASVEAKADCPADEMDAASDAEPLNPAEVLDSAEPALPDPVKGDPEGEAPPCSVVSDASETQEPERESGPKACEPTLPGEEAKPDDPKESEDGYEGPGLKKNGEAVGSGDESPAPCGGEEGKEAGPKGPSPFSDVPSGFTREELSEAESKRDQIGVRNVLVKGIDRIEVRQACAEAYPKQYLCAEYKGGREALMVSLAAPYSPEEALKDAGLHKPKSDLLSPASLEAVSGVMVRLVECGCSVQLMEQGEMVIVRKILNARFKPELCLSSFNMEERFRWAPEFLRSELEVHEKSIGALLSLSDEKWTPLMSYIQGSYLSIDECIMICQYSHGHLSFDRFGEKRSKMRSTEWFFYLFAAIQEMFDWNARVIKRDEPERYAFPQKRRDIRKALGKSTWL